ncbi:hypothetical protein HDU67_008307 [Dinochytrium kinnereticum]|nr:hypothetical protein HDU67_008307 [Dinochytrium kinnereticum]
MSPFKVVEFPPPMVDPTPEHQAQINAAQANLEMRQSAFNLTIGVHYIIWGGFWSVALALAFAYFGSKLVRILKLHLHELRIDHEIRKASVIAASSGSGSSGGARAGDVGGLGVSAGSGSGSYGSGRASGIIIREATANIRRLELAVIRITGMKWTNMVIMMIFSILLAYYGVVRVQFHTTMPIWWHKFHSSKTMLVCVTKIRMPKFYIILGSVPIEVEEDDEDDDEEDETPKASRTGLSSIGLDSIHNPSTIGLESIHSVRQSITLDRRSRSLKTPLSPTPDQLDTPRLTASEDFTHRPSISSINSFQRGRRPSPPIAASLPTLYQEDEEDDVGLQKLRNGIIISSAGNSDEEVEGVFYSGGWKVSHNSVLEEGLRKGSLDRARLPGTQVERRGSGDTGSDLDSAGGRKERNGSTRVLRFADDA